MRAGRAANADGFRRRTLVSLVSGRNFYDGKPDVGAGARRLRSLARNDVVARILASRNADDARDVARRARRKSERLFDDRRPSRTRSRAKRRRFSGGKRQLERLRSLRRGAERERRRARGMVVSAPERSAVGTRVSSRRRRADARRIGVLGRKQRRTTASRRGKSGERLGVPRHVGQRLGMLFGSIRRSDARARGRPGGPESRDGANGQGGRMAELRVVLSAGESHRRRSGGSRRVQRNAFGDGSRRRDGCGRRENAALGGRRRVVSALKAASGEFKKTV